MIELEDNVNEWAEKYGIQLTESECYKCKRLFPFTKAIALKDYRGVIQALHECGEQYRQVRVVPLNKEFISVLNNLNQIFKDKP